MRVTWLDVRDFRSYAALRFEPDPGVNVLVGDNGQGKTSVLEAISYLGTTKSFRGVPDDALIREGADAAVVSGTEGGGHSGFDQITTLCLVPQAADAVKIPVIAGGGRVGS